MSIWDWLLEDRDVYVSYRVLGIMIASLVVVAVVTVCVLTTVTISRSYPPGESASRSGGEVNKRITPV